MYGMVNRGIEELVTTTAGADAWHRVRAAAGVDDQYFIAMDSYDDDITYRLLAAASDILDTPAEEILENFGRYWILYTGAEGWGPILNSLGSTVSEIMGNLNAMHVRIQTTLPSLVMPQFVITKSDDALIEVEYHSQREGLAPMVVGLIKGLAERCGESWDVEQIGQRSDAGFDTFRLTARQPAPASALIA